jgi:regulator of nonsense transcripts 2
MGNELVQLLEAEFNELYETSDVIKIETKIRNIRFLSELTKFNVCPSQVVLECLKKCLDEFHGHHIEIITHLLECCGKYLVKMEDSKLKFNNLLDFLQRLKESNKTLTYPNPLPNYLSIEENINTKAMASLDNAYF